MQVKSLWHPGKKWEPDRSRGKRFRTRPRRCRGHWELFVGTARKKKSTKIHPAMPGPKGGMMQAMIKAYRDKIKMG